ncbi:MAG: purine-binding chemotaxis protein CheW [Nitrospirae bacterium]|nr:MAG: purine-binding chemotaxis protein CheW [Nitrospirota bacterium]
MRFLLFQIRDEYFALDVYKIVEIINPQRYHHVYDLPGFIEGLINLRGELIPVVSLRKRFDIKEKSAHSRIIIVRIEDEKVGLEVDEVLEIVNIEEDRLSKPSRLFRGFRAEFIDSVVELDRERVAIVLNLDRVLSTEEKVLLKGLGKGEKG